MSIDHRSRPASEWPLLGRITSLPGRYTVRERVGEVIGQLPRWRNHVSDVPVSLQEAAARVRGDYARLYKLPVIEYVDGSRSFHNGRLARCHGLNVLFLRGDYVEMAFQHGRLLHDEIPHGALGRSAQLIGNAIANSMACDGSLQRWMLERVQDYVVRWILSHADSLLRGAKENPDGVAEAVALGDSVGLSLDDLLRGMFNPEVLMVLCTLSSGGWDLWGQLVSGPIAPMNCCSTFGAWGDATASGGLVVGRNMDYPLNGSYDRYPTVIYYEPTNGDLKHMSFSSAGVHTAGITGYNEAGIFLSSHVVPSTQVSLNGVAAFTTANLALRQARTFDEATKLLGRFSPLAGWTYFVASTREGRVGSVEMSTRGHAIREAQGDTHVQTNFWLSPELAPHNLSLNASVDEDSRARYDRISQRLAEQHGSLDAIGAADILQDQVDPTDGAMRGLGNTVGVYTTLTSCVIDAARDRALVATGPAPVQHREYYELPLVGSFDREQFHVPRRPVVKGSYFSRQHLQNLRAMEKFIEAKQAYEDYHDDKAALEILRKVVEIDGSNPAYYFQLGIFALRNWRPEEARDAFDSMFECDSCPAHLRRLGRFYRAKTRSYLGDSPGAIADLRCILIDSKSDPNLRDAARKALRYDPPFGQATLSKRSLAILMQHSDMLRYS